MVVRRVHAKSFFDDTNGAVSLIFFGARAQMKKED
jgi:hypothetical protein